MCYNKDMKKNRRYLYYTILLVFCLVGFAIPVSGITKEQETAITDHCEAIRQDLKKVQRQDARARVYIGGRYETILSKFVMPMNVWLVEHNISRPDLIESQNTISDVKAKFSNDYVDYQQELEQLVTRDCKGDASVFYDSLVRVRQKRQRVERDMAKMTTALEEYKSKITKLKESLDVKAQ